MTAPPSATAAPPPPQESALTILQTPTVKPPSGASKVQLQLWQRILSRRGRQIQHLSNDDLGEFAHFLVEDLDLSRFGNYGDGENGDGGSDNYDERDWDRDGDGDDDLGDDGKSGEGTMNQAMNGKKVKKKKKQLDLTSGEYSSSLLPIKPLKKSTHSGIAEHGGDKSDYDCNMANENTGDGSDGCNDDGSGTKNSSNNNGVANDSENCSNDEGIKRKFDIEGISARSITLHFMSLFYRSLEETLTPTQRRHGLDSLKRGFDFLENILARQREAIEVTRLNEMDNRKRQLEEEGEDSNQSSNKRPRNDITGTSEAAGTAENRSGNATGNNNGSDSDVVVVDANEEMPRNASGISQPTHKQDASSSKSNDAASRPNYSINSASPPPSPLPQAPTLYPSPPVPLSAQPFSHPATLTFLPDNYLPNNPRALNNPLSAALEASPSVTLSYDAGYYCSNNQSNNNPTATVMGSCLDGGICIQIRERLETWDPYWRIVEEVGHRDVRASCGGNTKVGAKTTPCSIARAGGAIPSPPVSCAMLSIDLSLLSPTTRRCPILQMKQIHWGQHLEKYQTGDRRLIIRALPLHRTQYDTKKRADTHLWPKGTFIQLSQNQPLERYSQYGGRLEEPMRILQRRQQSHDAELWKGMSHALDVTGKIWNGEGRVEVKLCSKEMVQEVDNHLNGSYAIHAAICEYIDSDDLYDRLMGKVQGTDFVIPTLSLRSATKMARGYLKDQTVSIDDSDDEIEDTQKSSKNDENCLTFSLLCTLSKTAIETPVRGRNCKHMQRFDLRNFLRFNKTVSGGRWRCGICEEFLSVRDLVHCGLFQAMLDDNSIKGKVSGVRDRVSLRGDGSWWLMEENKLRYGNKGGDGEGGQGGVEVKSIDEDASETVQKRISEPEVIELM